MSRRFTHDDSLAFARLSGDYNPIHLDPIVARRSMFGQCVLHGMHLALWAVDQWLADRSSRVRVKTIHIVFRRPASAGDLIDWTVHRADAGGARINVSSDGVSLVTIELQLIADEAIPITFPESLEHDRTPMERSVSQLRECAGRLPLWMDRELTSRLFPNVARVLPPAQIATLLATTRLVGMHAPGLHSLLRGLNLSDASMHVQPELNYRATRFDERFSLLELEIESPGLSGVVATGIRPQPGAQQAYTAIQSLVGAEEFRGERALVIGGSRGLGEVATKLLAAGGAEMRFSYHLGSADADRVASEITRAGGAATCFPYDVLKDATKLPAIVRDWRPSALCYFATPFIFSGAQGRFSAELFRRFCDFYVTGFYQTLIAAGDVKRVLYPSSTAIEKPSPNLVEYAAAKAAGESLCRSLATADPERRLICPRFARLATDQTATLLRTSAADPVAPVLAALREMMR